ncbi:leucine-rich melanocyte differentiation-associated protein isoform X2 [Crotalus tigris]|uniref:leucine-rich melanocyte differentiation-associated protein isoform X2 n=1 Tax=Crotalus tigris TaxID=88082 RepID=UPI00192F6300|nr:leucine-rich melanocyte differentiation-associated protein isoform X2 [Crotalus tigris]
MSWAPPGSALPAGASAGPEGGAPRSWPAAPPAPPRPESPAVAGSAAMAGWLVDGTQVSYIGQDCKAIPEFLGRKYGSIAKRLDLSFNLLRLPMITHMNLLLAVMLYPDGYSDEKAMWQTFDNMPLLKEMFITNIRRCQLCTARICERRPLEQLLQIFSRTSQAREDWASSRRSARFPD